MEKTSKTLIKGAGVLAIGAFLSKLIGAFYRIPLTNLLGSKGIGLYQTVFPVYVILLDLSSAGVPSAISKMISSRRGQGESWVGEKIFLDSIKLFFIIGLSGSLLMAISSRFISMLQGNKEAYLSYLFLSPSVLLVSLISCFRGYFQGNKSMKETAISQVVEQLIKLVFGLVLARLLLPNLKRATAGAVFAVTISELFSLLYLFLAYRKRAKKRGTGDLLAFEIAKVNQKILKHSIPITLTVIALPLSQFLDSFLVVNILSKYTEKATSLYGLYSGSAITLIHLPTSVLYGISQVVIPMLSESVDENEKKGKVMTAIFVTLIFSIIFAMGLYFLSPIAVKLLFGKLDQTEKTITVRLVKIMSINVIFHSVLQTANGVLIANGKTLKSLYGMLIGVIVKTILEVFLLFNPVYNIYGVAVSSIACYFVACLINLLISLDVKVRNAVKKDNFRRNYHRE